MKNIEFELSQYLGTKRKLLLIMKLIFLLTVVCFLHTSATVYSQATKFSFEMKNQRIQDVLREIEKNSEFRFFYQREQVDVEQIVNLNITDKTVEEILPELFEGQEVVFDVRQDNLILIKPEQVAIESSTEFYAQQQQNSVSGKVTDTGGQPLPGVTVVVKGTTQGTVSNADGNYTLANIPENAVLQFSFVGMKGQEIVVGNQTVINVTMEDETVGIDEVVVTSFGIKKTLKQLTYSTQEVSGEELARAGSPNILNSLQGKVAGVSVNLNSSMPGKSPDIKIRGNRSLTGSNDPLYVIDGLPVSGGERAIDFNPGDIESINILKGPAAAALYGLRASNGVVVITTKSGSDSKGKPVVSFDTNFSFDQVGRLPDLQLEFAQGDNAVFNPNSIYTWGPRISSMTTYTNQLGEQEEPAVYDNDKDFFETGFTMNSNLSFSNSGSFGNYTIALGRNDQNGIVLNSGMERTNVKFNGDFNLLPKLTSSISVNYSDLKVNNFGEDTGNASLFRALVETPPSYNLGGKPYARPDDPYSQIFYRASQNNPYWVVNNSFREIRTYRTFGNIYLKYAISNSLAVNYRIGLDHYDSRTLSYSELGTAPTGRTNPPSGGNIYLGNGYSNQLNSNLFVSYIKKIKEIWAIDAIVGNEVYDSRTGSSSSNGGNLIVGNWPNLANATSITASNTDYKQRIVGFYGNLNVGWKDKIFLNGSVRNDIVSNMPSGNRSFIYPSVGLSTILTELAPGLKKAFSFAKIRATAAQVGQAGPLYVNSRGFVRTNPGGYFVFPYLGLASWTQSSSRVSPQLEPENTSTIELGADLRFLDNRIGLDYTFYVSKSDGQIFNNPVAVTTGATSEIRNGGEVSSQGHEIILSLIPVKTNSFTWEFNTNFTNYTNEVKSLYGDTERLSIADASGMQLVIQKGEPFPSFYSTGYLRDPETNQIVYESDPNKASTYGLPLPAPQQMILGSPLPDFEMSFYNSLNYKNISLSFQVDWRQGGLIYSHSMVESLRRGLHAQTLDRETEQVMPGKKGTIVNGQLTIVGDNDIPVKKDFRYYNRVAGITESGLNDASFVRLREVTLNYDFPERILGKTFINDLSVFLVGRNLFLITKSFTDPELNASEGSYSSNLSQGLEIEAQMPQTKSIGAGIRVKF
jgi:TonB-linked SusC/RagA family outer membrane protein